MRYCILYSVTAFKLRLVTCQTATLRRVKLIEDVRFTQFNTTFILRQILSYNDAPWQFICFMHFIANPHQVMYQIFLAMTGKWRELMHTQFI